MIRIAVLDDYQQVALSMADWSTLRGCEIVSFPRPFRGMDDTAAALRDFDVACLMRERTPFPRRLFDALPNLKCLVTTGLGNASIDLTAARERGVTVCHTRSGSTEHATAELAWGLILASARNLVVEDRQMRQGRWQTTIGPMLHGKTLGLLGLGRLGARMAEIGRAFGMKTLAWSPNLDAERAAAHHAEHVAKHDLFARSDVVSLHLVLSDRTRGIVGRQELGLMQPHAILVNTARAGLVDEAALVDALRNGTIAGAGLDVFQQEPLPPGHPLLGMDRVILSPHLGYVTTDTYRIFFTDVVEDIAAFLAGSPIRVLQPPA